MGLAMRVIGANVIGLADFPGGHRPLHETDIAVLAPDQTARVDLASGLHIDRDLQPGGKSAARFGTMRAAGFGNRHVHGESSRAKEGKVLNKT